MSIGSQNRSEEIAISLEKVLREGVKTQNPEIIQFLKKEIYPPYKIHLYEASYSGNLDEQIVRQYN